MKTPEQIQEEKLWLKAQYGRMFDGITALLFKHDPVGINFEDNADEYEPETRTILPRLITCHSAEDTLGVVHEEFVRWFDRGTAGPPEHYAQIASEIWNLWEQYVQQREKELEP
jgi:hypothetical protein